MEIYLVGGAVRDQLLGEPIKERDFVVVGATQKEMLMLGYKQVGKDFPVFLHPETHEEYALARTERKTGKGYTQFSCHAEPDVTLEADLKRRDLTINALAQTKEGKIIDPYGGLADLKNKVLRHVSTAFSEDPLRILRVARFAARFGDFSIDTTTMNLMRAIVGAQEIEALVAERVWQELERALQENYPQRFFLVLQECGALNILFPEMLPYFDTAMAALKVARRLSQKGSVRFAACFAALEPKKAQQLCQRWRIPKNYRELLKLTIKHKQTFEQALKLGAEKTFQLLAELDALRRPERFHNFLLVAETNSSNIPSLEIQTLIKAYKIVSAVSPQPLLAQGLTGLELKEALQKKQIEALK
jgi:tRNA nucleotidyltransferase (CCA-adding enzyme)